MPQVLDELARVFHEKDQAMLLAKDAGFPVQMLPDFRDPRTFWARIFDHALDGVLPGGISSFVHRAAALFPHNQIFTKFRDATPDAPQSGLRHAFRTIVIEASAERTRAEAEALRMDAQARLEKNQAEAKLMAARAFRELAEAMEALRRAGYEVVLENEEGVNPMAFIRPCVVPSSIANSNHPESTFLRRPITTMWLIIGMAVLLMITIGISCYIVKTYNKFD